MLNVAWRRQPKGYRQMCQRFGLRMGSLMPTGVTKPLSPQNRRVRFAADLALCRDVEHEQRPPSRQQRRFAERKGQ